MKYDLSHLTQPISQEVMGPIQDDEALLPPGDGTVYTIDICPIQPVGHNHKVIIKSAADILPEDLDNKPVDLIFFDCHNYDAELSFFKKLEEHNLITDDTVLALHDTNLHYHRPEHPDGFVHQAAERALVNEFKQLGYDIFTLDTKKEKHSTTLPFRHGVTICKKFKTL